VYSFLYLNPNITQGVQDGEFKFLGFQSYGANFTLDGQRSTDAVFGVHTQSETVPRSRGRTHVLSNDFSADMPVLPTFALPRNEANRSSTAPRFTTTRTRLWRAADTGQTGHEGFRAQSVRRSLSHSYFNFNDFGGSLGGPFPGVKKTWFFTAYERNYARSPVIFSTISAPPYVLGRDSRL